MASRKAALARTRGRTHPEGASFPVPPPTGEMPSGYVATLADLKARIGAAQVRAARAANRELIGLYWHVGATLVERQEKAGWGDAVVERLAHDLRQAFPRLQGFSTRNLWRMRALFRAWAGPEKAATKKLPQAVAERSAKPATKKLPQAVAALPWGHNILLLEKLDSRETRLWYAAEATAHGWSRATLAEQIATKAHTRKGKATTNFARALPAGDSDLAQQALKDPYVFDFLTTGDEAHERVTERELLAHIREFLLELGAGFQPPSALRASLGPAPGCRSPRLLRRRGGRHRRFAFNSPGGRAWAPKPEHAGKLNFYLTAVDDLLKHPDDKPSIGLLLCRSRNKVQVEHALRDVNKPIGVAQWETKLVESLPEEWKGSLPTVEEIEAELGAST